MKNGMSENVKMRSYIFYLYLLFISIFALALYASGPILQLRFAHDVPYIVDGAWRIMNGHIPHSDFHSPTIGPLLLFAVSFFMLETGQNFNAFVFLQIASILIICAWSYAVARQQFSIELSVLISFSATIFVLGVYHLGVDGAITYANLYNRYGFSIISIIIVECFFIQDFTSLSLKKFHGYSSGAALCLLLFNKITYFIAGILILSVFVYFHGRKNHFLFRVLLGFLSIFLLGIIFFKVNFLNMIADMSTPVLVKLSGTESPHELIEKFRPHLVTYLACCVILLKLLRSRLSKLEKQWIILVTITYLILGIFFHITNYGQTDMPLLSLLPINLIIMLLGIRSEIVIGKKLYISAAVIILTLPFWLKNLNSTFYAFYLSREPIELDAVDSERFDGFYVIGADGFGNENYVKKLNDGISLLRRNLNVSDRIINLSFENPFSFALGLTPAKNDMLVWHYGMTFNKSHYLPAETVFSDCTHVIYPRLEDPESTKPLLSIYGEFLLNNFILIDRSEYWVLLQKLENQTVFSVPVI